MKREKESSTQRTSLPSLQDGHKIKGSSTQDTALPLSDSSGKGTFGGSKQSLSRNRQARIEVDWVRVKKSMGRLERQVDRLIESMAKLLVRVDALLK